MRRKANERKGGVYGDANKTRERLVDAAAELFNAQGYWGTDSNRIARAAGYAPAMFYKHFRDKREVFLAAYSRWVATEWDAIRDATRSGRRATAARRIVQLVIDHHCRWAGFRRSLRALALTDDEVQRFRIAQCKAQLEIMAGLADPKRSPSPSDMVFTLLAFERICDSIADAEASALGATRQDLVHILEQLLGVVR